MSQKSFLTQPLTLTNHSELLSKMIDQTHFDCAQYSKSPLEKGFDSAQPGIYTLSGHKIKDFGRGAGVEPGWGRSPHTPSKPKSIG
ncbi:MAG: hypothetical protein HC780_15420 [Leptolyngbyaceae cyanobacterium CSU_1_3]|nr:hypothetical protein [Leptolyngbyaceae cyanobacterium CSU_1_3]